MASAGVGLLATATPIFASVPVVGWIVGIAAAVLDATVIQPALQGKGKQAANAPRVFDVPVGSNEAGAPRVWAIGRRIRVPTHVMWSSDKTLESGGGNSKRGTNVLQKRTYVDALVSLNDRKTGQMTQMIGNGKLLIWKTRNLASVVSEQMIVSTTGSGPTRLVLTMSDTFQPDFTRLLSAGRAVQLSGFLTTSGSDINEVYWLVESVTAHTSTPSKLTLVPASGQTAAGVVATAGTILSPAVVTRMDDTLVSDNLTMVVATAPITSGRKVSISYTNPSLASLGMNVIFRVGDEVQLLDVQDVTPGPTNGYGSTFPDGWFTDTTFKVIGVNATEVGLDVLTIPPTTLFYNSNTNPSPTPNPSLSATRIAKLIPTKSLPFSAPYFPSTFDPAARYHDGSDPQTADALAEATLGVGNVPSYNGVACQALEQFFVNDFGAAMPFSLEATIDPDYGMTWAQAYYEVLRRGGIPAQYIDTGDVADRPFGGMYLRGAVPTVTAMQPMLIAGQHVGQERDGAIAVFDIDNADVVQVENGAVFSDMGAHTYGQRDQGDEKIQVEDAADEELPTSVSVRHQDPDLLYAEGFQHFGLRNPTASERSNETEISLTNMALTRTEARNLAATVMRRAYINRRTYRFTLNASYLHVAENDLLTLTDDAGNDITCRVIQRDIGADFRVSVTALAERTSLAVSGSPVQSGAALPPPVIVSAPSLRVVPVDAPGIDNGEVQVPSLKLAVTAESGTFRGASVWESTDGSNWAPVGSIGTQAMVGTLDTAIASETAAEAYGSTAVTLGAETIEATFAGDDDHVQLDGATLADINAGKNWLAMVDSGYVELIGFTTATDMGDGVWELGGLYRGLRGTTVRTWQPGTQVVVLSASIDAGIFVRQFVGGSSPQSLSYKVVPSGKTIDDVAAIQVACEWLNARPLPVRSVAKTIGGSPYDARFTITAQWCRQVQALGTQPPHPIDEPFEGYTLTIYDPTGTSIVRTKTILATAASGSTTLRDRWLDYPAAEQSADGYTPGSSTTFVVDVQQVGEFGIGPSIKQTL
jgi:hypothetical protein